RVVPWHRRHLDLHSRPTRRSSDLVIKTDAHLYRLVWDEETAAIFYNDYWTEDADLDMEKVAAFENSSIFKLEYIGTETAWADLRSEEHTSELQSRENLVCRLLLGK